MTPSRGPATLRHSVISYEVITAFRSIQSRFTYLLSDRGVRPLWSSLSTLLYLMFRVLFRDCHLNGALNATRPAAKTSSVTPFAIAQEPYSV